MSVDHVNDDLAPVVNSENHEEVFNRLLAKYVNHAAPRLFALCRGHCEDTEDWVFIWGVAFDDSTVLFRPNGKIGGTFNSADSALNLFSRVENLCLVWVDPTTYSQPDVIAA